MSADSNVSGAKSSVFRTENEKNKLRFPYHRHSAFWQIGPAGLSGLFQGGGCPLKALGRNYETVTSQTKRGRLF
jgi:hypothetical protein